MKSKKYFIQYGISGVVYTENEFRNFIETAVLRNHDIHNFRVIELDSRLTRDEAIYIAKFFGLQMEVIICIDNKLVKSPIEALFEWDII